METDRYCSSMVRLFCGKELGFRNALTGNVTRCAKHKMLQTYDHIIGYNRLFYDGIYSSLGICHSVIRGSCDKKYTDVWPHTKNVVHLIPMIYIFNVVKEYDDIYIEIRKNLDGELHMIIDAKKIISKLSVSLEDEEWEKLKEIRN